MKTTYQALAGLIAALVMVQAATHAWSSAGAAKFMEAGGTLDLTATGGPLPFVEIWGIIVHTIAGLYVIPLLAVILVIVGYFSHVRGALGYGLTVAGLVAAQVAFGMTAPSFTFLAFLHGMNALLLFVAALLALYHVRSREDAHTASREALQDTTHDLEERPRVRRNRFARSRGRDVGSGEPVVGSGV